MVILVDIGAKIPKEFEESVVHYIDVDSIHDLDNDIEFKALAVYRKVVDLGADLVILSDHGIADRLKKENILVYS